MDYLDVDAATAGDHRLLSVHSASPTTEYQYNGFSEVIQQSVYTNNTGSDTLDSYFYYDERGLLQAQLDAGGYVTAFDYDYAGQQIEQTEFDEKLNVSGISHVALMSGTEVISRAQQAQGHHSRSTKTDYDDVGRVKRQQLSYLDETAAAEVTKTLLENTYDAVGNVIKAVDIAGNITHFYYDQLGRTVAVAEPKRRLKVGGDQHSPLTTIEHDVYGNAVKTTRVVCETLIHEQYTYNITKRL